jgi:aryl-alcohol dehydrogenase-like predicted oxidoreductase
MGPDYVDIFFSHRPDPDIPVEVYRVLIDNVDEIENILERK